MNQTIIDINTHESDYNKYNANEPYYGKHNTYESECNK